MHSLAADGPGRQQTRPRSLPAQRSRSVRPARLLAQRASHHGPLQAAAVLSAEAEVARKHGCDVRRMGGFEAHVKSLRLVVVNVVNIVQGPKKSKLLTLCDSGPALDKVFASPMAAHRLETQERIKKNTQLTTKYIFMVF